MKLVELSDELAGRFSILAKRTARASAAVKMLMIAGGSALATAAQFAEFDLSGPSVIQVIGIASSIIVLIGSVFVLFTENNYIDDLILARNAIEHARHVESEMNEVLSKIHDEHADSSTSLYIIMAAMRVVTEQVLVNRARDPATIADTLFQSVKSTLPVAMRFRMSDRWAVCVYQAVRDDEGRVLMRCIAHLRSIEKPISQARSWPEGIGVAGQSYSLCREISVNSGGGMLSRKTYPLPVELSRVYDNDRHRSIAAVPIIVGSDVKPWGVVASSCDVSEHFPDVDQPGIQTIEAMRALSGMIALSVAASRLSSTVSEENIGQ